MSLTGLIDSLAAHYGQLYGYAASQNRAAVALSDGTLRLFEMDTGVLLRTLAGGSGPARGVVVLPGGRYIAVATVEKIIRIWDLQSASEVRVLRGHTDRIRDVRLTDGKPLLISAGADGTAKRWDISSGVLLHSLTASASAALNTATLSPDGCYLITASADGTAKLWDAHNDELRLTLVGHTGAVIAARYHPDGERLVSGARDGLIKFWRAADGADLETLQGHMGPIIALHFTPDGQSMLTAADDRMFIRWDARTNEVQQRVEAHPSALLVDLTLSADGALAATCARDGSVQLWNTQTLTPLKRLQITSAPGQFLLGAAFSPDGKQLYCATDYGSLSVWSVATGERLQLISAGPDQRYTVDFSADGQYIVGWISADTVRVWNGETGAPIISLRLPPGGPFDESAFAPEWRYAASAFLEQHPALKA